MWLRLQDSSGKGESDNQVDDKIDKPETNVNFKT